MKVVNTAPPSTEINHSAGFRFGVFKLSVMSIVQPLGVKPELGAILHAAHLPRCKTIARHETGSPPFSCSSRPKAGDRCARRWR